MKKKSSSPKISFNKISNYFNKILSLFYRNIYAKKLVNEMQQLIPFEFDYTRLKVCCQLQQGN